MSVMNNFLTISSALSFFNHIISYRLVLSILVSCFYSKEFCYSLLIC